MVSFFDPRSSSSFGAIQAHDGARQHKLVWLGDSQHILTCGYSGLSEREFAIWDTRNFTSPLQKRQLDSYNGVPFTYYDEEHKVVFVAGKGDSAITYFQYSPTSPQLLEIQGAYKSKEPQKGFSFLPKRVLDTSVNEVAKGVRLTVKTIEYVSFKVLKKSGGFQNDLYPPIRSTEAAMTFDNYINNQDKDPLRVEVKPGDAHVFTSKSVSIT